MSRPSASKVRLKLACVSTELDITDIFFTKKGSYWPMRSHWCVTLPLYFLHCSHRLSSFESPSVTSDPLSFAGVFSCHSDTDCPVWLREVVTHGFSYSFHCFLVANGELGSLDKSVCGQNTKMRELSFHTFSKCSSAERVMCLNE